MKSINVITRNRRAYYDYFIEQEFEAGICLYGWEVKSLRAGNINITNSYIILRNNESYLIGTIIQPLITSSACKEDDVIRNRKLLLNKHELDTISYYTVHKRFTVIALFLYWKKSWIKLKIGIAKGKKNYDKRANIKQREWQRNKTRRIKYINC